MTKNHIKMYAEAKEIQDNWGPEVGDRVYHTGLKEAGMIGPNQDPAGFKVDGFIFLPDIEWFVERWHEAKGFNAETFLHELAIFVSNDVTRINRESPLHIIVLAFYMSEIHGKRWDEKRGWIDV